MRALTRDSDTAERWVYVGIACCFAALYLLLGLMALVDGESSEQFRLFGFSQLGVVGGVAAALGAAATLALNRSGRWPKLTLPLDTRWVRVALSAGATISFFARRTHVLNPDGAGFSESFFADIPRRGAHVTHDEMWELYLHSRFWAWTGPRFGWSVEFSYQVLSCIAGGVFVYLLLTYCSTLFSKRPFIAFMLVVSGGYMQLFFGEVENYTLTAALVMAYFLASMLFLLKKLPVLVPSAVLVFSLTFHLLSGFLIPSLMYLWWRAWKRGQSPQVVLSAAAFLIVFVVTLLFFHTHGLPISDLWRSSHASAQGGNWARYLSPVSGGYYLAILNLMFLLMPAWVLLVPLVAFKRIELDSLNVHLVIASSFMMVLVLFWRAQLGVLSDWNLYAIAAVPISLLVWRNVLRLDTFKTDFRPVTALGLLFFLHSYAWIIGNHLVPQWTLLQ